MRYSTQQAATGGPAWRLAEEQHGVVTRSQLMELGFTARTIRRRVENGRLYPVMRGVYAVGRPQLDRWGLWMAAVLSCSPRAYLSHGSAGAALGLVADQGSPVEVSSPSASDRRRAGVRFHRRPGLAPSDVTTWRGIPITSPLRTLLDLAVRLDVSALERAVNTADRDRLITVPTLRSRLDAHAGEPGVRILRRLLDRRIFRLTDSELERRFLRLIERTGLPPPVTGALINGFKVDFAWPELGLVVETDGLRYHRTPAQQGRDRERDQVHMAAGLTPLRFTHAQVRYEAGRVRATVAAVAGRLGGAS